MRWFKSLTSSLALSIGSPAWADDPPPEPPATAPAPFPEQAAFLGICGADLRDVDRIGTLQGMGVAYVETLPVRWDEVEPVPPTASAVRYLWKPLDELLLAWQGAGFTPILVVSPASSWASQPTEATAWARFAKERLPAADATLAVRQASGAAPPRDEHWRDWQRFLRDLVERYDGDGKDDAPGLTRPLRHLQILDQIQRATRWLGGAEEYLRLLHHAREAIDEAGARCEVIHAAVDLRGLVRAGDEPPDEWKVRLAREVPAIPPLLRLEIERGMGFVLRSVEMPRLYDALPHAGSGNLLEDEVNLRGLRGLLQARAVTNMTVWLTQSPTRRLGRARVRLPEDRVDAAEEAGLHRLLAQAAEAAESERAGRFRGELVDVRAWAMRGAAYDLVRGAARARAAGAARVLTYAPLDVVPRVAGEERTDTDEQGFAGSIVPLPRASWYAARQMNRLLLGHHRAQVAPLGAPGTAVLFFFSETAPLPWVAVLLPDLGTWAGEPNKNPPTKHARVPLPDGDVYVEEIEIMDPEIKEAIGGRAARRRMKVAEGMLALELTPAPLYVYPVR